MAQTHIVVGVALDESALTLEELARACAVEPEWVRERVDTGILGGPAAPSQRRFSGADLARARRLRDVERTFDADENLAALVVDLSEEVRRLRARLRAAGLV
ncbi:MerR family transcriptional regulator [Janthinobacterium fluminis]|uniref:MerR family transcriptional regulator n=1 Tax=Janthinobacterium fluminis TaxID=2987524 RepID=A0ABT5K115_9BURK|nr:MerR family transcriptional regulator [Janthinobacterium fluminis]MDC8757452.1 MerR family transcriptional regulator [Janthinobacterium fluminis]